MPNRTEPQWTREICKRLLAVNTRVYAIVGGLRQQSGLPDRYICHSIWQGWLEFKNVYTPLDARQKIELRELNRRQPGIAFILSKHSTDTKCFKGDICDFEENILATFDGSALDLLQKLQTLTWELFNERGVPSSI